MKEFANQNKRKIFCERILVFWERTKFRRLAAVENKNRPRILLLSLLPFL